MGQLEMRKTHVGDQRYAKEAGRKEEGSKGKVRWRNGME
jgi:hypothetical protein